MTKRDRKNLSLRSQIYSRIAPGALALLVVASLYPTHRVSKAFHQQIASQNAADAQHLSEKVEQKLANAIDACAAVAGNHIVVNAIIDPEHRKSTLQSYIRSIRMPGARVENVLMTDYRGSLIASKFWQSKTQDVSKLEWLGKLMEGNGIVKIEGRRLIVAHPVLYSGHPEAAIVTIYNVANFFGDLCMGTDDSATSIFHGRQSIACSDTKLVDEEGLLAIPEGWIFDTVAVKTVPELTITAMKSGEVVQNAMSAVWQTLLVETTAAMVILTLGIWIATSIATGSIHDFIQAIDDVRSNINLGRRVHFDTSSEFVLLGNQFNSMLEEIQNTTVTREEYRIPALVAKYTDNAVVVTDPAGVIEWVNEGFTRVTGYELHEVAGQKPGAFLQGPDTDPDTVEQIRSAIREHRGINTMILNYHRSGTPYWVDIEIRPIHSDTGELMNFIAIEKDITRRIEAENEKARLNRKMVGLSRQAGMAEVATGVLHNVGNVLNSVNTSAELIFQWLQSSKSDTYSKIADVLEQHQADLPAFFATERGRQLLPLIRKLNSTLDEERQEYHDEAKRLLMSLDHMRQIVAKQQDNARVRVLAEKTSFVELIAEALRIRDHLIKEFDVQVLENFEHVPQVTADRHMVIEILVNLIGNAVNAMEQSPRDERVITLTLFQAEKEYVTFAVKDTGQGIEAENLKKIFAHGFTTRKSGHGFGLHSSILSAKSMGGNLIAQSEGPGQGATFTLKLPCESSSSKASKDEELTVV